MNNIFNPSIHDFMFIYLDDILIFLRNEAEHLEYFWFVLQKLVYHILKAKNEKTVFGLDKVEYLRHIIQNGTIKAGPVKVKAVKYWACPYDVKQF